MEVEVGAWGGGISIITVSMSQSRHLGKKKKKKKKGDIIESTNQLTRIHVQVNATPRKATPHQTNFGLDITAHQRQYSNQHITRYLDRGIASATI